MTHWEQRYQQGETGWDRGGSSPALIQWLKQAAIKTGDRVLVPGCGRGHEVITLAQHGVWVTAIDIAPSATEYLQQQLKALPEHTRQYVNVILGDLFAFQSSKYFDVIYEQTCLCAIESSQRSDYAKCLQQWLKPKGLLLAQFMQTSVEGGPPFHCDLLQMRQLFSDELWNWPQAEPLFVPHHHGRFELGYALQKR